MAKLKGMWIITKPMRVKREGMNMLLKIGDAVPEADSWPNVSYWEARKFIRYITIPGVEKVNSKPVEVVQELEVVTEVTESFVDLEDEPAVPPRKRGRPRRPVV